MRVRLERTWWDDDLDSWFVLLHDRTDTIDAGFGKTRLIALRRAEQTLEKALTRVRKMREKEEAK